MSVREMRWRAWFLLGMMFGLTVWGCDGGDSRGRSGAGSPAAASASIGPNGGTLTSLDGKVTLNIPAGALGNTETITIESVDPADLRPELPGATLAWELKPDGLEFAQSVQASVTLPDSPTQADGSLRVSLGSLLTLTGGAPEALGNHTFTVDGASNTATLAGTLTHFSPLAFYSGLLDSSSRTAGEIFMELIPLPGKMTVGQEYRPTLRMALDGFEDREPVTGSPRYRDFSLPPLKHFPVEEEDLSGFRALQAPSPFPTRGSFVLAGYGTYVCEEVTEAARFLLDIKAILTTSSGLLLPPGVIIGFRMTHACEAPALPPPTDGQIIETTFLKPEALSLISTIIPSPFLSLFGLEGNNPYAAITHNPGMSMINIKTGEVVATKELGPDPFGPLFGAVAYLHDGQGCLFGYRERRFRSCWDPDINDFGLTEISLSDGPYHDAGLISETPVEGPNGVRQLLWFVEGDSVHQEHQPGAPGSDIFQRTLPNLSASIWFSNGGPPTGTSKSAFFTENGARVLVVRGSPSGPGQVWWGNPADANGGTFVGTLGNDTRKIRCKIPVCAVSNFGGQVTILVWDGTHPPQIGGTIPETPNAVGIDIRAVGDDREILSADFTNNTWTLTKVNATGEILTSTTTPVPEGCMNPGHGIFVTDPQSNVVYVVLSCNGVNAEGKSALTKIPLP